MLHSEFTWQAEDGLQLFAQDWRPESEPHAVVCLVHGIGEHSGRYEHLAKFLNQAGYALSAFDLRGHGKSQGQRGHAKTYGVLLDDISRFLAENVKRFPNLSFFLYGHSFGGALVLNYVLRCHPQIAGVIATGPSLRTAFKPPAWKLILGRIMARLLPTFSLSNGIDIQGLSRDKNIVRAYASDPLVHDRISARLGIDMIQNGLWAGEHAEEFPLPLLLMHGSRDHITSVQASREFAAKAGDCCTLKIWDDLYHEIHNEPEQGEVFAYLLDWLKSKK